MRNNPPGIRIRAKPGHLPLALPLFASLAVSDGWANLFRRLALPADPSQPASPSDPAEGPPPRTDVSPGRRPWLLPGFAFLTFLVGLPGFYLVATQRAEQFNSEGTRLIDRFAGDTATDVVFHYDQHVYLNKGRQLRISDYEYVVPRHRMPGYPLLLSLLYSEADAYPIDPDSNDPRKVSAPYFERAKQFNIGLSLALIVILFFFFVRYLPIPESLLITWAIAWLIFVFKAPFVQPEVLFMALSLMLVILLWRQIIEPNWTRGIASAVLLAGTYFVKSALLPLVALYVACFAFARILDFFRQRRNDDSSPSDLRRSFFVGTAQGALVPILGFALLSPYLANTWKMHGSPFWSVHSAHYYWLENVQEKKLWKGLAELSMRGEVPAEAPSAKRYLAEHTPREILDRFLEGTQDTRKKVRSDFPETERFVFRRLGKACLVIGLLFLLPVLRTARDQIPGLLFLLGFLIGYALLYGWFNPIRAGLRFMLSLYPVAIALGFWFLARFAGNLRIPRLGFQVHTRPILLVVLALCLGASIHSIVTDLAWKVEGGS